MNKRVFIKKRADFLVESHSLLEELKENLKETGLTELDLIIFMIFLILLMKSLSFLKRKYSLK